MFQLSRDEWEILRSKNSTSKSEVGFRWKKILPIYIYRARYLYAYECINGLACPRYKKLLKIYIMKCLEKCLTMIF